MKKGAFIDRKTFLRLATLAVVSAVLALWHMVTGKQKQLLEQPVEHGINDAKLGPGIYLYDTFILVKSAVKLKVFSNKCTHAGCRINKEIDGQLLCPCHGSRYDALTGKVLQGPAANALPSIPFHIDAKTGELIIKV